METAAVIVTKSMFAHLIYDVYGIAKESAASYPALEKVLAELDLGADLKVIEALLKQLEQWDELKDDHPLSICLKQVEEMIQKIKKELSAVGKSVKDHDQKWFSGWRYVDCQHNLENIRKYKKTLDSRVQLMIQLMRINRMALY